MNEDLKFLDEVRSKYFTETDEMQLKKRITINEVAELRARLFQVILKTQTSITTEVTESFIDELEDALKASYITSAA